MPLIPIGSMVPINRGRGDKDAYRTLTWEDGIYTYSYHSQSALTKAAANQIVRGK